MTNLACLSHFYIVLLSGALFNSSPDSFRGSPAGSWFCIVRVDVERMVESSGRLETCHAQLSLTEQLLSNDVLLLFFSVQGQILTDMVVGGWVCHATGAICLLLTCMASNLYSFTVFIDASDCDHVHWPLDFLQVMTSSVRSVPATFFTRGSMYSLFYIRIFFI